MRIAVVNWNDRKIGGAETYLAGIVPALVERGEDVAYWCELNTPPERASVVSPPIPRWCAAEISAPSAIAALRRWSPDLLFVHGLKDPALEAELQGIAPAAFFAHGYYGTCITGSKTVQRPEVQACERRFGYECLAHFYPKRCGGINPISMLSNFRLQARRLEMLSGYGAVLCASDHMREEYVRNGLDPDRLHLAPYPIRPDPIAEQAARDAPFPGSQEPWRILFAGRLERQKGCGILLEALPAVVAGLDRPVEVIFAGDGRQRAELEEKAAELTGRVPRLRIQFAGWVDAARLPEVIRTVDLLALPSVWPEPFGLIGLEAGQQGVPAVAFAIGGISDWLRHGINGMLAPASPPTPEGFAAALLGCLEPGRYAHLVAGARATALEYSMVAHMDHLFGAFDAIGANLRPGAVS